MIRVINSFWAFTMCQTHIEAAYTYSLVHQNNSVLIAAAHSLSLVWLFATPWTAARQAPRSYIISQSWLRFMSQCLYSGCYPHFPDDKTEAQSWKPSAQGHSARLCQTLAQHKNPLPSEVMPLVWPGPGTLTSSAPAPGDGSPCTLFQPDVTSPCSESELLRVGTGSLSCLCSCTFFTLPGTWVEIWKIII